MEFIEFFNGATLFFETMSLKVFIIIVAAAFAAYLICLVFGGIGLRAMAKRQGIKGSWLGFVPFANTYYTGKLAGDGYFFGQRLKRAGLYAMLSEILYLVMNALYWMTVICLSPYYVEYGTEDMVQWGYEEVPEALQWMQTGQWIFQMFVMLLSLVMVVFMAVLYLSLFRKYYARSPILLTFFSVIFPFRAFTVFAVRNNTPVDYGDYMRRRQEELYRQSRPMNGSGPYGMPYGTPYDSGRDDPFGGDFGSSPKDKNQPEDPFSEFDEPKKPSDGEDKH